MTNILFRNIIAYKSICINYYNLYDCYSIKYPETINNE